MTRLAVLGSPIAHSKSPILHAAAYGALGLDWEYGRVELQEKQLWPFVDGLDESWRGFSATMPLKRELRAIAERADVDSTLTGGANTLYLGGGRLEVFNTDVTGIVRALARSGVTMLDRVTILGGGATAASVLVAVARLGAREVLVRVRDPGRATAISELGERLGVTVVVRQLAIEDRSLAAPDLVVSTLPGAAEHGLVFPAAVRSASVFFEVAYDPWPSALAAGWLEVGGTVVDGLDMLVEQALMQVRIFVAGSPDIPLEGEADVLAAMRASVARVGG